MAGVSPAEWEFFLDEVWAEADENDVLIDQADSKRFIFITLGVCLLLATPAVWVILSRI